MKKIFLILAHEVSNCLVANVKYLSSNFNNTVLIHLDKKSRIENFNFLASTNVMFIEDRINVQWGDISVVQATIGLLKNSLEYEYEYCFLLSGDDLITMKEYDIDTLISENYGKDFYHIQDFRDNKGDPDKLVKFKHLSFHYNKEKSFPQKIYSRFYEYIKSIFFKNKSYDNLNSKYNINLHKGVQWFSLPKSSSKLIVDFIVKNPNFINIFSRSFCPDEIFFVSLLNNLNPNNNYHDESKLNNALRYIDWKSGPDYPKTILLEELIPIANKGYFFCRKIDRNISLQELEEYLECYIGKI